MKLNYVSDNREYQRLLDRTYHGKVIPIDRYINGKAVLLHFCLGCHQEFYGRPGWLLNKESQSHECYTNYGDQTGKRVDRSKSVAVAKGRKTTDLQKKQMLELATKGHGTREIARLVGVASGTVSYYLKKGATH
ncbi:hypothetical protein ABKP09_25905 [Peribacillus frigoritolerans]|uniref:hypothetical protein n=1 Tax=Peribacillus frigoritolerans TaxID=450367 RepID=UPI0032B4C041